MRRRILTALLLVSTLATHAQTLNPTDYVYPLRNVPGLLSANFGEMRPDHFHSGIDIKTDGVIGKPVVAIADGYISRIHVQPGGYGRAIYIAHPNGTTSVYGHLATFRADIETYVHEERYRLKQHSVNLFPAAGQFPLKQGEEFAKSGNTGASSGPHLHFEIRDSRTQRTINPITTGVIRMRDQIPPRLVRLHYVEVDTVRGVPMHAKPRAMELPESSAGHYRLKQEGPLSVGGRGYFILEVTDRKNDVANAFGVWRVSESVDDKPVFEFRIDAFAFDRTRYCNAVACYAMQVGSRNELIRLSRLEGCSGEFYPVLENRALLTPAEGETQQVCIEAEDDSGNRSVLAFRIVGQSPGKDFRAEADSTALVASYRLNFHHAQDDVTVMIPQGALYEPVFYRQSVRTAHLTTTTVVLSPVYSVLDRSIPLHSAMTLTVKADVPEDLQPHTTLAFVRGDKVSYAGGRYKNGAVSVNTRTLGDYCLVADTIPPKLTPKFNPAQPVTAHSITFAWSDNFSGLGNYSATLDGEWILLERNPMRGTITHFFDNRRTPKGRSYALVVTATDNCGNRTVWRGTISR